MSGTTEHERDEAWGAFLTEYSRLLLHVARAQVPGGSHDDAMDAYAHLLGALRADDCARIRTFVADGRSKFTTWLVVVSRRLCVDHHRSRFGRAREGEADSIRADRELRRRLAELSDDDSELATIADAGVGMDDALESKELRDQLARALETLEPSDRLILKLRFEDDLSAGEISRIAGLPTQFHVYRRLEIILASLKRAMVVRGAESSVG